MCSEMYCVGCDRIVKAVGDKNKKCSSCDEELMELRDALSIATQVATRVSIERTRLTRERDGAAKQRNIAIEQVSQLTADLARVTRERDEAKARSRRGCQTLLEELTSVGSENVDAAAQRACEVIRNLRCLLRECAETVERDANATSPEYADQAETATDLLQRIQDELPEGGDHDQG